MLEFGEETVAHWVEHGVFLTLFAMTYLYAGWQSWKLLFLVDPLNDVCPLELARRRGQTTYGIQAFFVVTWPLLMAIGWLASFLDDSGVV